MKILVIGSGGREHTLVWKIAQSPDVKKIYCAPGNAGISELADCVSIDAADIKGLLKFAAGKHIDLTVVGPEVPLSLGIVDLFKSKGLKIFGPSQKAAEIESSKIFSKYLMEKYKIPTAKYESFDVYDRAEEYVKSISAPLVVKADGLAAGKGAIVCFTKEEALASLNKLMVQRIFGQAGAKVVIEEYLAGEEVSVLAFTDGTNIVSLIPAQDHKPILDGDKGPNTGGMGAYAPAVFVDDKMFETIRKNILEPTIKGMALEERPYRGVLYAGLIMTRQGPKVIEFNCRFGDPETQVILPLIKSDIVPFLNACAEGDIKDLKLGLSAQFAVCVVLASGGYPNEYEKGKKIFGLDKNFGSSVFNFHAGTKKVNDDCLTNGGRVLGVTALGNNIKQAINRAYSAVGKIAFDGAYYRKDIGYKAL
ncbi:phosphoribosylamine--glycine ligase [candidate division KSB1 bacterium]|nr:phosphoribosylamine--glycine ligase [candidate division KSB1 bacterium]MBL7092967.1 phosphoribosylamine--glycine ligase [candidate division KSB1 bacterium]